MRLKKTVILVSMACLLFMVCCPLVIAAETHRVLTFSEHGLRVRAYAPYQANPDDTIRVRVTAEALEDLEDVELTVDIVGSKSEGGKEGYDEWDDTLRVLRGVDWDEGDDDDDTYKVEIPKDSDPGLVYGHVTAEWTTAADDEDHTYAESFIVTYVINEDYEELQEDYDDLSEAYDLIQTDYSQISSELTSLKTSYNSLQSDFNSLQAEYDSFSSDYDSLSSDYGSLSSAYESLNSGYKSLQTEIGSLQSDYSELSSRYDNLEGRFSSLDSEHKSLKAEYDSLDSKYKTNVGELDNSRNLMYVFVVTTIVFIATSIILLMRKPKPL